MALEANWPKAPAIYQIYPRSFLDTNGDGIGDLPGIIARLDHVAALGVDAVWLSPHYLSPWADGGYDVVDHEAVDPRLGTMEDFDRLVARAHDLGLRVMVDQVLNHTSCEHPWFLAALDGDAQMMRRYLFRDAKPDGAPPNNWLSQFGLPGWTWSPRREAYYFHQFLPCQPSLDLRNPEVQAAHRDQIAFWRARGVDGFRFDAVTSYVWDPELRDNPPACPEVRAKVSGPKGSLYKLQDHLHDMLPGDGAAMTEQLREWAGPDPWLMGEITSGNKSIELAMAFSEPGRLDAAYTTDLTESGGSPLQILDMIDRGDVARQVGWLSSHDQPRHIRPGAQRLAEVRAKALLMAFLPGPWLIYQGEEWGLPQPHLEKYEVTDPFDLLYWPDGPGREGGRVPLPWAADAPNFGFSEGQPWLPMRWGDAFEGREEVEQLYASLITRRRALGWDSAIVKAVEATDTRLDLTISATSGRYRMLYATPGNGDAPTCPDQPILTVGQAGGWFAAIWKVAEPDRHSGLTAERNHHP